jgi:hypothetical protein
MVDFVPRDDVDGEAFVSDGPMMESLDTVVAVLSAIHGGVGEVGGSDIPAASGSCCDRV